jgi:site-specific recombinase XerD
MLENGFNVSILQGLLRDSDVKTTEIYTKVMTPNVRKLQSLLDTLLKKE